MFSQSSWCSIIAKRTFVLQHGNRAPQQQPVTYTGMLTMLATSAYRAVMVFTSVLVSFALGAIPYGGPMISFGFMCWIDAWVSLFSGHQAGPTDDLFRYYCFE
jgi:etoposide-induced 2.4 mRNA